MIHRLALAIAVGAVLSASAGAQNRCPSCVDSVSGEWHMLPALGLRAGIPQKVSAAIGIVAGKNYREKGHTEDMALYIEPGLSAGRASLGYISGFGNMGSGFGVAATAMRTWKDPINLKTNETFIGGEAWVWPLFFSGPRVGVFRKITGTTRGWYLTADFGFGL
ncbi:MAG TPA: hypothetical protein VFO55_01150 [Gemmatimonadaceae bacterium]|nr:hypothetical protein [Gemmatimonadaceae bacterium]